MRLLRHLSSFSLVAVLATLLTAHDSSAQTINEVRIDEPGADVDEYFEIKGTPGSSLAGLTYLVIGDGTAGCGTIECVVDLGSLVPNTIPANGLYAACRSATPGLTGYTVTGVAAINFENSDNVTHMIVSGFTGALNGDVDVNNDGVIDTTPWTSIVDCVALIEDLTPACGIPDLNAEPVYCATRIGPDGGFVPGHAYVCSDAAQWAIGPFDKSAGRDTPGQANPTCFQIGNEKRTPCAPLVNQTAAISADVSSAATAVTSVHVFYKVNGGAESSIAMTLSAGTTYTATLPAQTTNGALVEYYVRAINAAPDTIFGFNQGYFVGTKTIGSLRVNDANGRNIYRFYGVNIRGNITARFNTYSAVNTDGYIQDATGGINVFQFGVHSVAPNLGDDTRISGAIDQFNGKLEISPVGACDTMIVEVDGPGAVPAPLLVNSCTLKESVEGRLIRMQYPQVNAVAGSVIPAGVNTSYQITNCFPDTVIMFIDVDTDIDGSTLTTNMVDVTGIAGQFDSTSPFTGGYQINPRSLADITYVGTSGTGIDVVTRPRLFQNAPNPFADKTTIRYEIAGASKSGGTVPVQVTIYDIAGRKVTTLVNENMTDGQYAVSVDAGQLGSSSGIYFYELKVDGKVAGRQKLVVSR